MKSPAFRFYPSDFWGSPDVQAMDLHEVAAYLSLMSAAWLSDRPGCLADDDEKLRRWARMTREQWAQSRNTLLVKFPVLESGIRVNLRLYREAKKQEIYSESQSAKGKKGGRPKAGAKPELCPQKPELFSGLSPEKPSVSVSVSASVLELKTNTLSPSAHSSREEYAKFKEAWNDNCGVLSKITKLSSDREKRLSVRIRSGMTLEEFTRAVRLACRTPYLRGTDKNGWRADFDWLLTEKYFLKVLEGSYGSPDAPPRQYRDITDEPESELFLVGGLASA